MTQEQEATLENEQMIRKRRADMGYQTKRWKQSDIARHLDRDYESLQKRNKLPLSLQPQPMEEETNFCGTAVVPYNPSDLPVLTIYTTGV